MSEPGTTTTTDECASCGAEIVEGEDFCRECGHSVGFGQALAHGELDEDRNAGVICPACGATHMVQNSLGQFVCETCQYSLDEDPM